MRILLVLCGLVLCSGCDVLGTSVTGSGVIKREAREIGDFTKLSFAGSGELKIVAGAELASCEVQCDDNLLQYFTTEVVDGELRIHPNHTNRIAPTKGLQIEIRVPTLAEIHLAGGTTTTIADMNQATFTADLAGSHELHCAGQVETVQFKAAGSCGIAATDLNAKVVSVQLAGSGTVEVQASEKLSVDIMGTGTVRYRGEPAVTERVSGSGKINKMP